jgi:hypothetical protein
MRREAGILLGVVSLIWTLGTDQETYVPENFFFIYIKLAIRITAEKMEEKYELQKRESVKIRKRK